MDSKSLELLEFPQITEIVAGFTSFSASRELALNLKPFSDCQQAVSALKQSAEARHLLSLEPSFSIGGITDIREPVKLAARGKVLEPAALLEIQQTLAAIRLLRESLEKFSEECPLLWNIGEGLVELRQVEKGISRCLTSTGEILDSASSELSALRHEVRHARNQLMENLKATIDSPTGRKIVQEPIITEREGRYVIPVKIESRKEIKGIVHDVSNSEATAFVEPLAAVELGNTLRELVARESREVERILRDLSAEVGSRSGEISHSITLAAILDLALAKARYARRFKASEPSLTEFGSQPGTIRFVEARHPLLAEKAVPFSVEIGKDFSILVITGPNTGGKTVALKTIGLLSLMAQAGIPVPAASESCIPFFDSVFADIGDEQSIEQTLSTFSWHTGNIVRITHGATEKSLVLLDELATNTDPAEGSALARAILLHFLSHGTMTVVTSHYTDLKAFAHTTRGMQNASLDFDPVTLMPTYHLTLGIPGGSNAIVTASRLGLSSDIIENAREMLSKGTEELEALLNSLTNEKQEIEALRVSLEKEKEETGQRNTELKNELERMKAEERKAVLEIRDKIVRETSDLNQEIRRATSSLRKEKSKEKIEEAKKVLAVAQERLKSQALKVKTDETAETGKISPGDVVWLKEARLPVTVLSVSEDTGRIEVQAGKVKLTLGLDSVEKIIAPGVIPDTAPITRQVSKRTVAREVDLRGKHADEVEPALDSYLNDASLAGLIEVRIIHGISTGVVRQIVRDLLASHPLVKSFRPGERGEGGDGVTIAKL